MTVRAVPTFLQAESHPAENVRLMMAGMFGSTAATFTNGVGAVDPGHGIVRPGHLAVSENGTPDMSVDVAAGGAFIRGSSAAAQGVYHFYNDATVNLSVGTSDPTNARRDLVVAQVRDSSYAGADDDARLFVVQGTASGSPADPAVPDDCLVLARIAVGANATSIVNANITDVRTLSRPWNTAWGVLAVASATTQQTFSTTAYANVTGLTVSAVLINGRRYLLRAYAQAIQVSNTGFVAELGIWNEANTVQYQYARKDIRNALDEFTLAPSRYIGHQTSDVFSTFRLRGKCSVASTSWKTDGGASNPVQFAIEDMGPL